MQVPLPVLTQLYSHHQDTPAWNRIYPNSKAIATLGKPPWWWCWWYWWAWRCRCGFFGAVCIYQSYKTMRLILPISCWWLIKRIKILKTIPSLKTGLLMPRILTWLLTHNRYLLFKKKPWWIILPSGWQHRWKPWCSVLYRSILNSNPYRFCIFKTVRIRMFGCKSLSSFMPNIAQRRFIFSYWGFRLPRCWLFCFWSDN